VLFTVENTGEKTK